MTGLSRGNAQEIQEEKDRVDSNLTVVDYENRITVLESFPYVQLKGSNGDTITASVENIHFSVISNPSSIWDEITRELTVPVGQGGVYQIAGAVRFSSAVGSNIFAYIDTGSGYAIDILLSDNVGAAVSIGVGGIVILNDGDKLAIRTNTTGVIVNDTTLHHLFIKRIG